jgi:hypothetical protein
MSSTIIRQPAFSVNCTLTRPNDTTAYTAGDIINNSGSSKLPSFDLSSLCTPGTKIQITNISILDEFGTAATKLQANLHLFSSDTLTGYTPTDNAAFAPTFAEVNIKKLGSITGITSNATFGTNAYVVVLNSNFSFITQTASDGKLYFALCPTNTYSPGAQKKLIVNISGYIL